MNEDNKDEHYVTNVVNLRSNYRMSEGLIDYPSSKLHFTVIIKGCKGVARLPIHIVTENGEKEEVPTYTLNTNGHPFTIEGRPRSFDIILDENDVTKSLMTKWLIDGKEIYARVFSDIKTGYLTGIEVFSV